MCMCLCIFFLSKTFIVFIGFSEISMTLPLKNKFKNNSSLCPGKGTKVRAFNTSMTWDETGWKGAEENDWRGRE